MILRLLTRRRVSRWAKAMVAPGAAVIVDTETTDMAGSIVELAVVDAASGETLLDTLLNPGIPIAAAASRIHGISDEQIVDAPTWLDVLPVLRRLTSGKSVLAYNADYDRARVVGDCVRFGVDPGHLALPEGWGCLMRRRAEWLGSDRWLPLDGGHRALEDSYAARSVLLALAGDDGPAATAQPKAYVGRKGVARWVAALGRCVGVGRGAVM